MISVISVYFSALIMRFIILLFFCSFVPLILLSSNYPLEVAVPVFKDMVLVSLPWFLWLHQAIFCGFITPRTLSSRITLVLVSTMISAMLLMGVFPYTQKNIPLSIDRILPNIVAPKGSIIPTAKGTLVIDPNSLPHSFYATKDTKALWIDSEFLLFNDITTNSQSFELSSTRLFDSFQYLHQRNSRIVPFYLPSPIFTQYKLGEHIIQLWFDSVVEYHSNVTTLYQGVALPSYEDTSSIPMIHLVKDPRTNISLSQDPFVQKKPQEVQTSGENIQQNSALDYLNVFLSLLGVFLIASLLGICSTLGQHLLGALSIITLLSFFTPSLSIQLSTKLMDLLQIPIPTLLLHGISVLILYVCSIILLYLKNLAKGVRY